MPKGYKFYFLFFAFCLLIGCNQKKMVRISGELDYVGSSEIFLSKKPIHYKYAEKIRFPVNPQNGAFNLSVPVGSTQIIKLHIDDKSYPLVAAPGHTLKVKIQRAKFPLSVDVSGYSQPYDSLLTAYRVQEQVLLHKIANQLPAFHQGDTSEVNRFYKKRYQLAREFFQESPLENIYHKTVGEYLVKRLENIEYRRKQPGVDAEGARQDVINEAKKLNFFSLKSLYAQRAGIRDFTNAFANTFGVADSIERKLDRDLIVYDIKRLGYEKLDSARTSVLEHIDTRQAKAYAKMYLIAERIGEMPLKIATPSYRHFLNEYKDFPRYTSFLKTFYKQIRQVSPGQPAIPFSLKNSKGEIVQMKDLRGKYVLLDFWAAWCIPCLDEFPHMKEIYADYSRNDFEILAISIEEDSLRWRRSIQRFDNPWPQLYGGNGFQQKLFRTYRGGGIPFYILIGPEGNILRYNDIRPSFNLPRILDSLINQPIEHKHSL